MNPLRLNTWLCPQVNDWWIPKNMSIADSMKNILLERMLLAQVRDIVNAQQSGVN